MNRIAYFVTYFDGVDTKAFFAVIFIIYSSPMNFFIVILFFVSLRWGFCSNNQWVRIVDSKTNQAVTYANIHWQIASNGAVSNDSGYFSLSLPLFIGDSIVILETGVYPYRHTFKDDIDRINKSTAPSKPLNKHC
ncbi:MAG: hypothetical protein CVU11_06855 [Bacteroidetes bacterium HGW-Bacteroidetes-6]|nr:MAG: hypothetical protein CVU11_06855 [Bacteroidetes bacterium HGW-Bacteroidetes-6]